MKHPSFQANLIVLLACVLLAWPQHRATAEPRAPAADKSGVSPRSLVLPKGPGSLQGFGASYQWMPSLAAGTARYAINLSLPPGPAGHQPSLAVVYDSGKGNGPIGLGWGLDLPAVRRRCDRGLPRYAGTDSPIAEARLLNRPDGIVNEAGEELVPTESGAWFCENEAAFLRYRRAAAGKNGEGGWEAVRPDGERLTFGTRPESRVCEAGTGRCSEWLIDKAVDPHGNEILYTYCTRDGKRNLHQKYITRIDYGAGPSPWRCAYFVLFRYDDRPDWFEDARPGFLVRTGARLKQIIVGVRGVEQPPPGAEREDLDGDGKPDYLVRRYDFVYVDEVARSVRFSLLASITEIGSDGRTALPAHRFGYTAGLATDKVDVKKFTVGATGLPSGMPVDGELIELVDLNADGLPDLLQTHVGDATPHSAAVNLGETLKDGRRVIRWGQLQPVEGDPRTRAINLATQDGVAHLVDLNGDGKADLVYRSPDGKLCYFANQGNFSWGQEVALDAGAAPPAPFAAVPPPVRTADLDGDRRIDLIESLPGGTHYQVWFCVDGNKYVGPLKVLCEGGTFDLSRSDVSLADMNGDGVLDLVWIRPGELEVRTGLGFGRFAPPEIVRIPGDPLEEPQVKAARLVDVNGDGTDDLVVGPLPDGRLLFCANRGNYILEPWTVFTDLPRAVGPNPKVRWADMNGNGSIDLVILDSQADLPLTFVDLGEASGSVPRRHLLNRVDNGRGKVLEICYASSTDFAVHDADHGHPWKSPLPFPVAVIAAIDLTTGPASSPQRTKFRYHDGYYDPVDLEFRGFGIVEATEIGDRSTPTLVTSSEYDTGRAHRGLKGKLLKEVASDEHGSVFYESVTTWTAPPVALHQGNDGRAITFAHPLRIERTIREGGLGKPVRLLREMEFDRYGNQSRDADYGVVEVGGERSVEGDEVIVSTVFNVNPDSWLLRLPARREVSDGRGRLTSRTDYHYDDDAFTGNPDRGVVGPGNLTLVRRWLNPGNAKETWIDSWRGKYDQFGNLVRTLDPISPPQSDGQVGHFTDVEYDPQFHAFPIVERLWVGGGRTLEFQGTFDPRYGLPITATAPNGATTRFEYDSLARVTRIYKPGDIDGLPSAEFAYELGRPAGGSLVNWVESRLLDRPAEPPVANRLDRYLISRQFSDGEGRVLLTKQEAEPDPTTGQRRALLTGAVTFNARGKANTFLSPCFSVAAAGANDVVGTLNFEDVTAPDWRGSFYIDGVPTRLPFDKSPRTTREYDAVEREVGVVNPDGSRRRNRHLPLAIEIYDEARANQLPIVHHFDGQGRLVQVDEHTRMDRTGIATAQRSIWSTNYEFDPEGGLISISDSQRCRRRYVRDGLGRVISVEDPNFGTRVFSYDAASNVICTRDAKGQKITFTYDGVNRLLTEDWDDGNPAYSPDPRMPVGLTNRPDVVYFYDERGEGGFLTQVWDRAGEAIFHHDGRGRLRVTERTIRLPGALPRKFVSHAEFDALDRVTARTYPDNDVARFAYNERGLLTSIRADSVGAVLVAAEYEPSDRRRALVHGNGVRTSYCYDTCSRPTRIVTEGENKAVPYQDLSYRYDAASNLTAIDDRRGAIAALRSHTQAFEYDDLQRLARVTYAHDGTDSKKASIAYRYDPLGNLVHQSSNLRMMGLGDLRYGNGCGPEALSQIGPNPPQRYDANGAVTEMDGIELKWDLGLRVAGLRAVHTGVSARYGYDYTGRRIWKQVERARPEGAGVRAEHTIYVDHDYEVRPGDLECKYITFDGQRIARIDHSIAAVGKRGPPQVTHYHSDHLGSVALLTDQRGELAAEQAFYPFGETRWDFGKDPVNHGFIGTERDGESGLLAFEARYLHGLSGRFLSPDPALLIGSALPYPQALNPYAYAANRPFTHNDPDGNFWSAVITAGFAAYDTYQYAVGNISGSDYAVRMTLNGAALLADVSTAGMGGGMAVRAANAAIRGARVVTRVNSAVSTINTGVGIVEALAEGDLGDAALMAAPMLAGRVAGALIPRNATPRMGITGTIRDIRNAGLKDAHHIIQDKAVRELKGYNTKMARGIHLSGPSTTSGTPHYAATQVQRQAGGGTYAAERRIGYKALRRAGVSEADSRRAIQEADDYFSSIGVRMDTPTRIPGNR